MSAFLLAQLDYIFFFYGLAFILLGALCFAIARGGRKGSWVMLGLFGFVHGASEWLDLIALIAGDGTAFRAVRTSVMAVSYAFLMEFARQEGLRLGWRLPGRWAYVPLFALVATAELLGGATAANIIARYTLGIAGTAGTSLVFGLHAKELAGNDRRLAISLVVGFALYCVAAGVITPAASFWPAVSLNYEWFAHATGIPIQMVRGLLAGWIAFSIWAIWGRRLVQEMSSARYTRHAQKQFVWTLATMATILVAGWWLTEYLGGIYKKNVEAAARGDIELLVGRLEIETASLDRVVKILAAAPSIRALSADEKKEEGRRVLHLAAEASGADTAYVLDRSGRVVATSANRDRTGAERAPDREVPDEAQSIAGQTGHHFAFEAATGTRSYYASYPIRAADGDVVGTAILKKSLHDLEENLREYGRAFALIDPHGVVVLTNRPEMMLRTLWPLSAVTRQELLSRFGQLNDRPLMDREVSGSTWAYVNGARQYVTRHSTSHSLWSLLIFMPAEEIFASRVLGIAITLLSTIIALVYLFARERAVHDHVQMDKRLELQELASDLRFRASTDPLTGLHNRHRLNEAMALEISRSQRYATPLSVVLFDIDHFKQINDTFGHLAGDQVLVELSRFVDGQIRDVDVLARWGGEEFAILLPECDVQMARRLAEKLRDTIGAGQFGEETAVTCSFGIAEFAKGDTAQALLARADRALYRAKINGRNRVELDQHASQVRSGERASA